MNLIHYTERPFVFSPDWLYVQVPDSKPKGLWLSAEGADMHSWRDWCTGEDWGIYRLAYQTKIKLRDDVNVLHIATEAALRTFSTAFRGEARYRGDRIIDWPRVAAKYAGIIIAPYQWNCRLDHEMFWYYGWDCASGCIWDLSAIERVIEMEDVHG